MLLRVTFKIQIIHARLTTNTDARKYTRTRHKTRNFSIFVKLLKLHTPLYFCAKRFSFARTISMLILLKMEKRRISKNVAEMLCVNYQR